MRWLLHGNFSSAIEEALGRRGDAVVAMPQPGIETNDPSEILKSAHHMQLDIITTDPALANAPFERQIKFGRSIVFLQLEGGDVEQEDALDRLFHRYKRLTPGRLYTVTATRVKVRQLPTER